MSIFLENENTERAALVALIHDAGLPYWKIAAALGVHENTVGRWMRQPNAMQAKRIREAVASLTK